MAMEFKFQAVLDALRSELIESVRLRDELDRKIVGLRQSVSGLLRLRDANLDDEPPPTGLINQPAESLFNLEEIINGAPSKLTVGCRSVIKSAKEPLTAGDVKRELEMMGFDFSGYASNPLSSIHTTLKRDSSIRVYRSEGRTVYQWINPLEGLKRIDPPEMRPKMPPPIPPPAIEPSLPPLAGPDSTTGSSVSSRK